ncbi:MAG: S1C family serine protease, partial [Lacipirellulaceae bacterium]
GERRTARVVASDPVAEVALLETVGWPTDEPLDAFDLAASTAAPPPAVGDRVWALSNAFAIATGNESMTVQRGVLAAVASLDAWRPAGPLPLREPVLVIDAVTSNPGAAGGAVVDADGQLLGMIGKEARSGASGAWHNFALPAPLVAEIVARLRDGGADSPGPDEAPATLDPSAELVALGVRLLPDVALRTPPFIELVEDASPAAAAGLRADDLFVAVDGRSVSTIKALLQAFAARTGDATRVTVLRGAELIEVELPPAERRATPAEPSR